MLGTFVKHAVIIRVQSVADRLFEAFRYYYDGGYVLCRTNSHNYKSQCPPLLLSTFKLAKHLLVIKRNCGQTRGKNARSVRDISYIWTLAAAIGGGGGYPLAGWRSAGRSHANHRTRHIRRHLHETVVNNNIAVITAVRWSINVVDCGCVGRMFFFKRWLILTLFRYAAPTLSRARPVVPKQQRRSRARAWRRRVIDRHNISIGTYPKW